MKFPLRAALVLTVVGLFLSAANGQSLGEAARKARKNKPAPSPAQRVYTNENMPTGGLATVSGAGVDTRGVQSTTDEGAKSAAGPAGKQDANAGNAKEDYSEWRTKFAEQKNKIELLE